LGKSSLLYETKPDQKKHFVIQGVKVLSGGDWFKIIDSKNSDEALVFVHGYNTSFDDSLYRMAQIIWDLQYHGVAVLYSWASRGKLLSYSYDRESVLIDSSNFIELLKMLETEHGIRHVHVLAHSMGNLLVMDALRDQAKLPNPVKVSELVMAAPDVDRDFFTMNAPQIRKITAGMTLYASAADKALVISRRLAGGIPRAGDVPPEGPIVLPQLDSIDVTAVGSDLFGLDHDTFAGTRSVMTDIHALLTDDPRRLPNLRSVEIRGVPEGMTIPRYFRFSE
jgi:esterase/lipase superfamily enzyme